MSPAPTAPATPATPREVTLISHSPLFYWWPIWLLGYIMAFITYQEGNRLAVVPSGSKVTEISEKSDDKKKAYEFIVPAPTTKDLSNAATATVDPTQTQVFKPRVSQKAWLGPLFCIMLMLMIVITNVPMRGLWSFIVLLFLIVLALTFSVLNLWDGFLKAFGDLHIYINMAGYLFIAITGSIIWVFVVGILDTRTYLRVTPGQIQMREHIGGSVRNFDTTGLVFEKQRDDLFRHWILGFFSGDLIVKTSGAERETFRLPNVLWVGWKLEAVNELLREKTTVSAR